jgi:hypothetical protein
MKKVVSAAKNAGREVDIYHCSSDPDSLDGIVIDKKTALIDGTAPHSVDTELAGARDEIVDLGAFWDSSILRKKREQIEALSAKKREAYRKAYRFLSACDDIFSIGRSLVLPAVKQEKLEGAVRRMLDRKIDSKEKALTISELGYKKNFFVRTLFRDSSSLHRVVKCVEEEEFYAEQNAARLEYEKKREEGVSLPKFRDEIYRIDVENDRFYIPEELEIAAATKFRKKGSTWLSMLVSVLVLTVAFIALLLFLPWFLGELDNAFGVIAGK